MSEVLTHPHDHQHAHEHPHSHEQDDGYMALRAEDLYHNLARKHAGSDEPEAHVEHSVLDSIESKYNLTAVHERTAATLPELTAVQKNALYVDFAAQYASIPVIGHDHHHNHDHDGCGKRHGPIRKFLEKTEHAASRRFKSQRAKVAIALLFRAGFFTMCPGDDIAAIGLQVYGSISGAHTEQHHEDEHGHGEIYAVLPRRPRIVIDLDRSTANVDLPLNPPVPHKAMPNGPIGQLLRETVLDIEEKPQVKKPEKTMTRKSRTRVAALGLLALSITGLLSADSQDERVPVDKANISSSAQPVAPEVLTPPVQQRQSPTLEANVLGGDTQWSLAEKAVTTAGVKPTPARVHSVAAYIAQVNKKTNPNPHKITEGQQLKVPAIATTKGLLATLRR